MRQVHPIASLSVRESGTTFWDVPFGRLAATARTLDDDADGRRRNHMKDKTTRREPCRRTNAIEPRIRPLVSVLNATGLVTTFSSCEGHFGRVDKESLQRP